MAAPRAKISNLKTIAARYGKGESLASMAAEALPKAVGAPTLRRALEDAGVEIRPRPGR